MKGITSDWHQNMETILDCYPPQQIKAMRAQFPQQDETSRAPERRPSFHIPLNTRPDPIDHRDLFYEPSLVEIQSFLYPEQEILDELTVRNQGVEGSCTGQALAAVIDMQNLKRWQQGAIVPKRVSSRMAYENAKLYDAYPDDGLQGSSLRGAIKGFYHHGICDAVNVPYFDGEIGWQITREIDEDARAVILGAYLRLRHVLNHYHAAISEAGAILCSAVIHDGWSPSAVASQKGRIPFTSEISTTSMQGIHAFAIVGYDSDGFLVLNSWGREWGAFNPYQHPHDLPYSQKRINCLDKLGIKDQGIAGIAHWCYDDWAEHVVDAWVLRLTAPTRKDAWYSGGYYLSQSEKTTPLKSNQQTPRSRHVLGHYIHLRNGRLVEEPPYHNTLNSFNHTEELIEHFQTEEQGKHLLFYAHGGLDTIESASARAAAFTKVFRSNGIYPLFYFWRTGFGNMVQEVLRGMYTKIESRSRDNIQIVDHLLERQSESIGRAIWRDLLVNARNCFAADPVKQCPNTPDAYGAGWKVTKRLLEKNQKLSAPMKVHYVAHSAGVFVLGELFRNMIQAGFPLQESIASVSLMAPACTTEYFENAFSPLLEKHPNLSFHVYNLPDAAEHGVDSEIQPYNKSLLYLISNAFEDVRGTAIAGLDRFWTSEHSWSEAFRQLMNERITYIRTDENLTQEMLLHSRFDNCADVMNDLLTRIKSEDIDNMRKFTTEELKDSKF